MSFAGMAVGWNSADVDEWGVLYVGIDPCRSFAGEEECCSAKHEVGQVGHVAVYV